MGNIPYLIGGLLGVGIGIGCWVFIGWLLWKAATGLLSLWRKKGA